MVRIFSIFLRQDPSPVSWFRWYTADPIIKTPNSKTHFIEATRLNNKNV